MQGPFEVLVLDDEEVVCERLKSHLEKKGFQVETFNESQLAIDRLAEKTFDVVITDMKMEGPTGMDVLHFVRRQSPATQVIIITGYGSMETFREAEYSGSFEFIHKPFTSSDIEALAMKAAKIARKQGSGAER